MIIIQDLKYVEIEGDFYQYFDYKNLKPYDELPLYDKDREICGGIHALNVVRGRIFTKNGKRFTIGLEEKVAEILELQYEVWNDQENYIKECDAYISELFKENIKYKNASLWTRIKWVFTKLN